MMPPTQFPSLDAEAISGICGSVSIACWVVVFSPQIIEQWQRRNADSLSVQFVIIWLLGDVFNILGGWLQGILPTMMILAVYYTLADLVLLCQCFYYRGFTWRDPEPAAAVAKTPVVLGDAVSPVPTITTTISIATAPVPPPTECTALLGDRHNHHNHHHHNHHNHHNHGHEHDWSNLSPAVPLIHQDLDEMPLPRPLTTLQTIAWNTLIVIMVIGAGVAGWALGRRTTSHHAPVSDPGADQLVFSVLGQVFGYLCAAAYVGSRLPQLILNHRRRSTEGLSMLFFLFACLGNVTYVLSILAYRAPCSRRRDCLPGEAAHVYGRYMLVNLSWLLGSSVTLLLDLGVFAQHFIYNNNKVEEASDWESGGEGESFGGHGTGRRDNAPVVVRSANEIEQVEPLSNDDLASEDEEEQTRLTT